MQVQLDRSDKTQPSREQVLEEVNNLSPSRLPAGERGPRRTRSDRDFAYDSLDVVELAMELEENFDVTVPDTMSEQARTVGQIADGVMELIVVGEP